MMIINDDSRVINKLEASLTDYVRVVIYDCHMFIVQATVWPHKQNFPLFVTYFVPDRPLQPIAMSTTKAEAHERCT